MLAPLLAAQASGTRRAWARRVVQQMGSAGLTAGCRTLAGIPEASDFDQKGPFLPPEHSGRGDRPNRSQNRSKRLGTPPAPLQGAGAPAQFLQRVQVNSRWWPLVADRFAQRRSTRQGRDGRIALMFAGCRAEDSVQSAAEAGEAQVVLIRSRSTDPVYRELLNPRLCETVLILDY